GRAVAAVGDSGLLADILERAVAPVPKEMVGRQVVGNDNTGAAIAVQVPDRHAERLAVRLRDARLLRNVLEAPVAQVAIETAAIARIDERAAVDAQRSLMADLFLLGPVANVVADEQIEFAVVIVVQPGGAGGPVALIAHARLFGYIAEESPHPRPLSPAAGEG